MNNIIGVVLAGGRSTRMGKNKATLELKGKKLLDRMITLLNDAKCEDVYVSGDFEGYNCIVDVYKNKGPLSGIYSALRLFQEGENVLFVPVDMPCISIEILQDLKLEGWDAVCFEGLPLPLCIKNTSETRVKIEKQIEDNNLSIKALLQQLNVDYLPVYNNDKTYLKNINTPEQWAKIA